MEEFLTYLLTVMLEKGYVGQQVSSTDGMGIFLQGHWQTNLY